MNTELHTLLSRIFNMPAQHIHKDLTREDIGNWDSLKQMDMVATLEAEYDVTLEIEDIIRIKSIKDIIDVLSQKGVDVAG